MSWTLCTSGSATLKAGTHANITGITADGADFDLLSDAAEGRICMECNADFVTNFADYPTLIQQSLADVCSSLIAMDIIAFDTTGYLRREADTLMNYNDDRVIKGLKKLQEKEYQGFSE